MCNKISLLGKVQVEVEDWRLMAQTAWCSGYMVTADFTFLLILSVRELFSGLKCVLFIHIDTRGLGMIFNFILKY